MTLCIYEKDGAVTVARGANILSAYDTEHGDTFYKCPKCITVVYRTSTTLLLMLVVRSDDRAAKAVTA